jgi:hypothetical protein
MYNSKSALKHKARQALYLMREISGGARRREIISHKISKKVITDHLVVPDIPADEKDVHHAERLLRAYHMAIKDYRSPEYDLWTINSRNQAKFFGLLKENDPRKLAQYLCNMNREDATIGTVQGNYEYERIMSYPSYRKFLALMARDKFISLAEAFGVLPIENPEQGHYGENIHQDPGILFKGICSAIGYDITPPPIDGGLLKIKVGGALFNERDCNAIYTAYTIKSAGKVCEIGGGAGRVCYWSKTFGVREYAILDLPHINVVQGFYLLKSLGEQVSLFGETDREVRIIPCHRLPDERFDLVLNQDSFPEIGKEAVTGYLHWIRDHAAEFLSINHESKPSFPNGEHINVYEVVRQAGGLKRTGRALYWLRKGYVAERYSKT